MYKFLFTAFCWGQKLHRQTIASQGINSKIANGMTVSQSVGQINAAVGNFKNRKLILGQGYIQSFGIAKSTFPIREIVTMMVYPNPVVDIANFKFSSEIGMIATLDLYDNRGRLIIHQIIDPKNNSFTYNLSMLSEGVYFAKIETTNQTFSTKIFKSK